MAASWLNAVDGFFAKLTKRRLQRGVFRSPVELQAAKRCVFWDTRQRHALTCTILKS